MDPNTNPHNGNNSGTSNGMGRYNLENHIVLPNTNGSNAPYLSHQFVAKMRKIHCSGMLTSLPGRLAQAQDRKLSHLDFFEIMIDDELAIRSDRAFARRVKQAGILEMKEMTDFDWNFNPLLPRERLMELTTARFVANKENVLLFGPPGIGKSHMVVAIALNVIRAGYRVLIKNTFLLADEFAEAEVMNTRRDLIKKLTTTDLLILEDFGMKTLKETAGEDFLDVIMRRHGNLPILITTNRPTEDWGSFLKDVPAATAILDRFLEHCDVQLLEGKSYRTDKKLTPHAVEQLSSSEPSQELSQDPSEFATDAQMDMREDNPAQS